MAASGSGGGGAASEAGDNTERPGVRLRPGEGSEECDNITGDPGRVLTIHSAGRLETLVTTQTALMTADTKPEHPATNMYKSKSGGAPSDGQAREK